MCFHTGSHVTIVYATCNFNMSLSHWMEPMGSWFWNMFMNGITAQRQHLQCECARTCVWVCHIKQLLANCHFYEQSEKVIPLNQILTFNHTKNMAVHITKIHLRHLHLFKVKTKNNTDIQNIFDLAMFTNDSGSRRIKCIITSGWNILFNP